MKSRPQIIQRRKKVTVIRVSFTCFLRVSSICEWKGLFKEKRDRWNVKRNVSRHWVPDIGSGTNKVMQHWLNPRSIQCLLLFTWFWAQHYSIIEIFIPLNRILMCVRIIEIVMIIIIFIKKCFPVSCNGTQEIIYLKEVYKGEKK